MIVEMNVEVCVGYAPAQIVDRMTLSGLLAHLQAAIEEWGPEAEVVLHQGDDYGASYGRLEDWDGLFSLAAQQDEDEEEDELV